MSKRGTKYTKREVEEAIMILNIYGQNNCTFEEVELTVTESLTSVSGGLAWNALMNTATQWCIGPIDFDALEAAQRLREGWRP